MGRRLQLGSHLSPEEFEQRYKSSKHVIERSHYQLIWLLQCSQPTAEAAEVTGYSQAWVYELVRSDNEQDPSALGDQRQQNRGHGHSILDDEMQALLWQA